VQTRREVELAPRRGLITDRRGEPLAVTQDVDSIFIDPGAFDNQDYRSSAAEKLARVLRLDRKKVLQRLSKQGHFVWLRRRVDGQLAARVRALGLDGVEPVRSEEGRVG